MQGKCEENTKKVKNVVFRHAPCVVAPFPVAVSPTGDT